MKRFVNKTFLSIVAVVLVAGTAFFASCEKDSEKLIIGKNKENMNLSNAEIDVYSEELCKFHSDIVYYFCDSIYEVGMRCDSLFIIYTRDMIIEKSKSYPFKNIPEINFEKERKNNRLVDFCLEAMKYDTLNLSIIKNLYLKDLDIDVDLIEKEANECIDYLEKLFYISTTPEEMENKYKTFVNEKLLKTRTTNEYTCLKFYTDMYISSFASWCTILYGDENKFMKKEEGSWWSSTWKTVKDKAKEVWTEVKPVVAADASGAVTGAITGAMAGGNVVPGAAVGAGVNSIGKCVEIIVESK